MFFYENIHWNSQVVGQRDISWATEALLNRISDGEDSLREVTVKKNSIQNQVGETEKY